MTKKFRFYDKEYKQWRELPDLFGDYQTHAFRTYGEGFELRHFLNTDAQEKILSGDLVVQQWTGLTDSQGVEIYEGDIVFSSLKSNGALSKIFEVQFEQGAFNVGNPSKLYSLACDYTVKGNIFQNPELLEKC